MLSNSNVRFRWEADVQYQTKVTLLIPEQFTPSGGWAKHTISPIANQEPTKQGGAP
jgi:hypothetical protein